MNGYLESLGVSSFWISVLDILTTTITFLVALILFVKGSIKSFRKLVSKIREIRCFKAKIKALHVFSKWYLSAAKDGIISNEEISIIDKELNSIIDCFSSSKINKND